MASLDHLAVSAATLGDAAAHVEAALGVPMGPGGRHPAMGTHNRLTGLGGGEYLEAIAVDPDAPAPGRARWFGLDRREGPARLSNWIVRVGDLEAAVARFPAAGRPVALSRGALRWRMAVPEDGVLPWDGCFPALIEWETAPPRLAASGIELTGLTLQHPDADGLRRALADLLDEPRLSVVSGPVGLHAALAAPDGARVLE